MLATPASKVGKLILCFKISFQILEECGYDVPLSKVEAVQTCLAAVGISGERMTLFYAEVEDSMKRSGSGGGVAEEGEMIETVEMSLDEARWVLKKLADF